MTTTITVPLELKNELLAIADKSGYPSASAVLHRGAPDELVVENLREAQEITNIARIQVLDALLKFPYWDDSEPNYSPEHEDKFQDVQMGIYEKTVYYVSQHFEIEPRA
jgi:protoporphyrinogen oxidase